MKKFLFFILIISSIILSGCVDEEENNKKIVTVTNAFPVDKYTIEDMENFLDSNEYINGAEIDYLRICEDKNYIEINNDKINIEENTLLYYPILAFLPEKYNEPKLYVISYTSMRKDDNILIGESDIIEKVGFTFIIFADLSTISDLESYYGLIVKSDEILTYPEVNNT